MRWRCGRPPRSEAEPRIAASRSSSETQLLISRPSARQPKDIPALEIGTDMKRLAWSVILLSSCLLAADQPKWQGTWAASLGTGGPTLAGTWNAAPGQAPDTVAGPGWVRDQKGAELATGTWAAGKEEKMWKGTWQARRSSGQVYDGT